MGSEAKKNATSRLATTLQRIPGAALLFAIGPLLILGYLGWYYYGAEHLDQALYSLERANLKITDPPPWIQSNVLDEVFESRGLDRISLLDPSATATIAQAFESHDWVKSTSRVTKSSGGQVDVDLVYRRPAAMVFYSPSQPKDAETGEPNQAGFFAVDEDGVILPSRDFVDRFEVSGYFTIFAQDARPAGDVGMSFGDARIAEALELCAYLEQDRDALGLQEIWVNQARPTVGPSPWILKIVTKDKLEIDWGHAPLVEAAGEPTAPEKRARLITWLEQSRAGSAAHKIDLSTAPAGRPVSAIRD